MSGSRAHYWWGGLTVATALRLRRLPRSHPRTCDVDIEVRAPSNVRAPTSNLELNERGARMMAADVGVLLIDTRDRRIVVEPVPHATEERLEDWIVQVALPVFATLRGHVCMHAVAVAHRPGFATLWAGDSGTGKSCAAAAQLDAGAQLVADDIVLLRSSAATTTVAVGAVTLRLRPEIAREGDGFVRLPMPAQANKIQYRVAHAAPAAHLVVERVAVRAGVEHAWSTAQAAPERGVPALCDQVLHWQLMSLSQRKLASTRVLELVAGLFDPWDPVAAADLT